MSYAFADRGNRKWTFLAAMSLCCTMASVSRAQAPQPPGLPAAPSAQTTADSPGQSRASLGVTLSDNKQGKVWIRSVLPGSGADQAGLRANDQIVGMDNHQVFTYLDVIRLVNMKGASEDIQVHILRNGKTGMLTASLGSQYSGNPPGGAFTEYPAGTPTVTGFRGVPNSSPPPEFVNPNGLPPVAQPQPQQ